MEIEEVIDAGDRVVVMASVSGTGKDSGGRRADPTFPFIWTIRDGQAIRVEALPTRAEALKAVGMSEEPPDSG